MPIFVAASAVEKNVDFMEATISKGRQSVNILLRHTRIVATDPNCTCTIPLGTSQARQELPPDLLDMCLFKLVNKYVPRSGGRHLCISRELQTISGRQPQCSWALQAAATKRQDRRAEFRTRKWIRDHNLTGTDEPRNRKAEINCRWPLNR
jgi:hypothetical protein